MLDLLKRLQAHLRIAGQINEQRRLGIALQILQDPDIEVHGDLRILADELRVGHVEQALADHFAEVLVGGGDQECDERH
ncbi:MAG: hypothetical protein IPP47_21430 [Bryobacterales bacterium]|nr:hypothetical protein [Bryobacterales bacterium]